MDRLPLPLLLPLLLLLLVSRSRAAVAAVGDSVYDAYYCSLDQEHTMCQYRAIGSNCSFGSHSNKITEEEKKIILDTHNYYRAKVATGGEKRGAPGPQPAATDMQFLVWDDELAAIAQRWADQCTFEHDSKRFVSRFSVGQNLFQSEGGVPWREAITSWYSEVEYFDKNIVDSFEFDKITGHYTQMIWGNTRFIGCGKRTYPQRRRYKRDASLSQGDDVVEEYAQDQQNRQARRIDYYSWNRYNDFAQRKYESDLNAYNRSLHQYYEKYKNLIQNRKEYKTQLKQYADYLNQAQQLDEVGNHQNKQNTFNSLQKKYETFKNIYDRQLYYQQKLKLKQSNKKSLNPVISKHYDFTTQYPVVAGVEFEYYVCNYGPSGNFPNARIYTKGPNKCPYYGLCSDPLSTEYYPALEVENDPILSVLYSNDH